MEIIKWLLMPTALLIGFLLGSGVKRKVTKSNKIRTKRLQRIMQKQAELENELSKQYEILIGVDGIYNIRHLSDFDKN